jgi:aminopeptidase YwaD
VLQGAPIIRGDRFTDEHIEPGMPPRTDQVNTFGAQQFPLPANDNDSGTAAILEVARTLHTLISEGRIPPPKRTIRFLWGPEFSGTGPWVQAHQDLMEQTLCNINMDMVGEWLSKNQAFFNLMRTTYGNAHYINDVMENYYRFVGDSNRERIQNRSGFYKVPRRMVAPSGSDDPFYYSIETHYGSSDHEVFNDWAVGVPGVMMIAWPDRWYHTSGDRADKADPTVLKRVAVIGAAGAYTVASADDDLAIRIASETASNGTARLGHQFMMGLEKLNQADAAGLTDAYRAARYLVEATVLAEQATLASVNELAEDTKKVGDHVAALQKMIEGVGQQHLTALEVHMNAAAARLGTAPARLRLTDLERRAGRIVPKPTERIRATGYRGYQQALNAVPESERARFPVGRGQIASTTELQLLCNGTFSALDIKKLLDAQFQNPSDLQAVLNHLELLKLAGLVDF